MTQLAEDHRLKRWEGIVSNLWTCRADLVRQFMGQHRDIDEECDWPNALIANEYRGLYDRNAIAERVVEVYPKECFKSAPLVYEDEHSDKPTEFEDAWDGLSAKLQINGESWLKDEEGSLIHSYMLRADIMSGIGVYGIILIGIGDGKLLEEPIDGVQKDGMPKDISGVSELQSKDVYGGQLPKALEQPLASTMGTDAQYFGVQFTPMQPQTKAKEQELLFLRIFDETLVQVVQYEASIYSPRFGMPIMYRITLNDPRQPHTGIGLPLATVRVHWSRVIHIADNLQSSEIFGAPRLRAVINNILDLRKLYGGSAEMYWRGAFPGLSIETHPNMGGDAIIDQDKLRGMMEEYHTGLSRWLGLLGMSAKSLAPQVVDPRSQIDVQIEAICIKLGCPVRVFKGSERGELASSQDDADWNGRLHNRRQFHITPRIYAPFIDRLITIGVLPKPEQYHIEWPDLDSTTKKDKAGIALSTTQALAQYVSGGIEQIMPPMDYYTRVLGWDEEEAGVVLQDAEEKAEEDKDEAQALAEEHGFEPKPPDGFQKPPPPPPPPPVPAQPAVGAPSSKAELRKQKAAEPAQNVYALLEDEEDEQTDGRGQAARLFGGANTIYKTKRVVDIDAQRRSVGVEQRPPLPQDAPGFDGNKPVSNDTPPGEPDPRLIVESMCDWLGAST